MSRGWWRRNAVALAAVAVLLPATGFVVTANEWWAINQSQPVFPTTAEAGARVMFADAEWGPASAEDWSAASVDLPPDAKVIVVEVPVDPGDATVACTAPVLRELGGAGRQWSEATYEVGWDDDRPTFCSSEVSGPFTIAVPFLLPADAEGPFGVDLTLGDELPGFLRLVVVP